MWWLVMSAYQFRFCQVYIFSLISFGGFVCAMRGLWGGCVFEMHMCCVRRVCVVCGVFVFVCVLCMVYSVYVCGMWCAAWV